MGEFEIDKAGGIVSVGLPREMADADVKAKFDELMSIIQHTLELKDKSAFSQEDANVLALTLNELYMLRKKGGFNIPMDDATTLLFALFKTTGYDPAASPPVLTMDLKALQDVKDKGIAFQDKTISLQDILEIINPENFLGATLTLGDAALDFVRFAYGQYAKEAEQLGESVEAATKVIQNLTSLQSILNHVKTRMPDNYKFPPEKWSDIPTHADPTLSLQEKLKTVLGDNVNWDSINKDDPNDPEFNKVLSYLKHSPGSQQYVDWSDDYFKAVLGTTADPQPGDIPVLLKMRDSLIRQMAVLKKGGAPTDEGTPYDTISKLLETINGQFPPSTYPPVVPNPDNPTDSTKDTRAAKDWDAEFGGAPFSFDKIPGKYASAKEGLTQWINSGQGSGKTNDLLDQALNANQRLSDDMSKKLQAKNQQLTQVMDMLTQLIDTLNKILTGITQKMGRG